MRIGVDIDGVLNYNYRFMVECGTKYCSETGHGKLLDLNKRHISEMYGWTREERNDFWDQYGALQMCIWPAQTYAAEVIDRLRSEGHEIWIITGRNNNDRPIQNMLASTWEETTKLWLEQNDIHYDSIAFNHQDQPPTDKGTFCAENHIDLMIEDDPDYLRVMLGKVRPIVFDQPYNREPGLLELDRAYSWYDLYQRIKTIENSLDK